jgi:hypothetical protein
MHQAPEIRAPTLHCMRLSECFAPARWQWLGRDVLGGGAADWAYPLELRASSQLTSFLRPYHGTLDATGAAPCPSGPRLRAARHFEAERAASETPPQPRSCLQRAAGKPTALLCWTLRVPAAVWGCCNGSAGHSISRAFEAAELQGDLAQRTDERWNDVPRKNAQGKRCLAMVLTLAPEIQTLLVALFHWLKGSESHYTHKQSLLPFPLVHGRLWLCLSRLCL